jgi:hypothetical protein
VKDVGEPGAGEPHARIDGRGLETERHGVTAPALDPTILPDVATGQPLLIVVARGAFVVLVLPAGEVRRGLCRPESLGLRCG